MRVEVVGMSLRPEVARLGMRKGGIASAQFEKPHSFAELGKPPLGRLPTVPLVETTHYPRAAGHNIELMIPRSSRSGFEATASGCTPNRCDVPSLVARRTTTGLCQSAGRGDTQVLVDLVSRLRQYHCSDS